MSHDHSTNDRDQGSRHKLRLAVALAIVGVFFLAELTAAILTQSLTLLADAGHMFADVLGLAMASGASVLAARRTRSHQTYGLYRAEVLAALANAVLLFFVAVWVIYEAVNRLGEPTDVPGVPMLIVAIGGLLANIAALLVLRSGASKSINMRGAYLEVVADAIGSVGAIIAAILIVTVGWQWADPLIAIAIGLFVLPRAWSLGRSAVRILTEASPKHVELPLIESQIKSLPGVLDLHDLHVWTVTSGMEVATAHVVVTPDADTHSILDQARALLSTSFGIDHATLQLEPETHDRCEEINW